MKPTTEPNQTCAKTIYKRPHFQREEAVAKTHDLKKELNKLYEQYRKLTGKKYGEDNGKA